MLYKSNQRERKCIICNNHRYIKGRLDQLINIALKRAVHGTYVAESTLKEYFEIHLKLDNEKYIDSANRILLVLGTSSLFSADASYHKSYYDGFRSFWWKTKLENKFTTQVLDNNEDPLHELFRLIQFHIVQKHEIYTLSQLPHFYEEISTEGETKSTLHDIDLKNKLVEKFDDKLKFCDHIETLIPNAKSSLSQVLLSLNIYRKTGSSEVITDLHRIGHRLSYTEIKFIEDKCAEWSENQLSQLVPNNIDEHSIVTLVAEIIDWKNKIFKGEETHNTNFILIQENTLLKDTERIGIILLPDYDFYRKAHNSYKGSTTTLDTINFVRGKCKLLEKKQIHRNTEYEK